MNAACGGPLSGAASGSATLESSIHNTNNPIVINSASNPKDDLKTHFITREGVYKQMTLSEYSRPNRVPLNQGVNNVGSAPVRVSFLTMPPSSMATTTTTAATAAATTSNNTKLLMHHSSGTTATDILVNGDIPAAVSIQQHQQQRDRDAIINVDPSLDHPCHRQHHFDDDDSPTSHSGDSDASSAAAAAAAANCDRICFNVGRELYVFLYRGVQNAVDLNKPIDKRVYKGTYPTSHDFNQQTATPTSCSLIIGFSAGQIQLIDPFQKEFQVSRLYNEDRFIDKTAVTCLKWVPGQPQCFLASHSSGNMYLYNEELPCTQGPPSYQILKQGDGYTIYTCKTKTSRNPLYRWSISNGAINQFAFSSTTDAKFIATVSHDGFLRVFNYHTMELLGFMKSYFGGLLCLAWSPDARYIVTGGEDDLITVYSVLEKRIVCRGQGHKSWISQVAFDPYTSHAGDGQLTSSVPLDLGSDEDLRPSSLNSSGLLFRGGGAANRQPVVNLSQLNGSSSVCSLGGSVVNLRTGTLGTVLSRTQKESISSMSLGGSGFYSNMSLSYRYRIGSVGHDTQLCLWDLTEDVLRQPMPGQRHRNSTIISIGTDQVTTPTSCSTDMTKGLMNVDGKDHQQSKDKKFHKRGFSFGAKFTSNSHDRWGRNHSSTLSGDKEKRDNAVARLLGTPLCPRMDEVSIIEPLICKKIAHERLTGLEFREDCIVTACQEGFILTWARPGKALPQRRSVNSPIPIANSNIPGGTVV